MTKQLIKKLATEVGFDCCGMTIPTPLYEAERKFEKWIEEGKHGGMQYLEDFKERAKNFWEKFPGAKSIIVLGLNYFSEVPAEENNKLQGKVARYAWGRDYHHVIREKIEKLKIKIQENTKQTVQFEYSADTKPLLERSLANRAGLGFIGKQTQLLSLSFGPWLFLAELVTDLELEPDKPFQGSCGTCRLCIDVCPTSAIEEGKELDARKCIAYLTIENKSSIPEEFRPKMKNWVFGCDECLDICPYTAKQKESICDELKQEAGFGPQLDLERLFEIKTQGEYEKIFGKSAISRAKRKQLLRNACVVLGNSKDERAVPVLEKAAKDSSELVREHAAWALRQLPTP